MPIPAPFLTLLLSIMLPIAPPPTIGGWQIGEADGYCGMTMEYEGRGSTVLVLGLWPDGDVGMSVSNTEWTAQEGKDYDLIFRVDRQSFGGGTAGGFASDGRRGFATKFGPDFLAAIETGSALRVYRGETLVDSLALTGSRAAAAAVRRCVLSIRRKDAAAAAEKARFAHIPTDPFAGDDKSAPASAPSKSTWITNDDYPPSAIRAAEQGKTTVAFLITPEGRVAECRVTGSSGSDALDRAACQAITRRGRYRPAVDAGGKPIASTDTFTMVWKLPDGT